MAGGARLEGEHRPAGQHGGMVVGCYHSSGWSSGYGLRGRREQSGGGALDDKQRVAVAASFYSGTSPRA
jgi:hypothetical protein